MSVLSVSSLLSALCAFTLISTAGCGTDAKGVDDCRDIQDALCTAAKSCGVLSDVDACKRYYRDDCLHGLPVASPGSNQVKLCVAAIQNAGSCAASAQDPATPLTSCDPPISASSATSACNIVTQPELATDCAFLAPASGGGGGGGGGGSSGSAGSGGASAGTGGETSSGGTSGTAGSDDSAGGP